MKPKVLITAREVHDLIPKELEKMGFEIDHLPEPSESELCQIISKYTGLIITTYTQVNRQVLDQSNLLKFIGRVGAGLENVDVSLAERKGIHVFNSPEGNCNAVGEHALALLLNLMNRISPAHQELVSGIWHREENRGEELDGKTVGIIGLGHTGTSFAKKIRGFDVEILAYDKFKTHYGTDFIQESNPEEIAARADVISVHIPYSTSNHHLISADFLASLQKRPYLIHTCRGAVADTQSLLDALQNNQIRGLGIDVYEDEPWTKGIHVPKEVYQKIFAFPQVIATPHIAGWTQESKIKLARVLLDKISDFIQKNPVVTD